MAIKNVATSAVLGLLFVSLVAIYLLIPTNNLVLSLSVLIMLVSLIVAQSRGWREIGAMAVFAAGVTAGSPRRARPPSTPPCVRSVPRQSACRPCRPRVRVARWIRW